MRGSFSDIRLLTGEPFTGDVLDLGKHVRPNWSGGRMVLGYGAGWREDELR